MTPAGRVPSAFRAVKVVMPSGILFSGMQMSIQIDAVKSGMRSDDVNVVDVCEVRVIV